MFGFLVPLETFTSQAYGAGDIRLCGVYLNRALILYHIALIPIFIILLNTKAILLGFGQDPEVVRYAEEFIRYALPGTYLFMMNMTYRRWLINMKKSGISLFLSLISLICYLTVAYLYVIVWDYEIKGIALALFAYGLCYQICA